MREDYLLKKNPALPLIILFLLILFSSHAEAKTLHGDWHYSGDTFTVEDDVIMVTHYNFYDTSVILDVNDKTYIINEGGCEITPTRKYCVDEIFRDIENADEDDPLKFEAGIVYAGIYVTISTRGPDISLSREFSTTTPELNEEVTVTVTVKNNGEEGTDSFFYQETLPKGVILTASSSGTKRTARTVTYESNIPFNSEKTFTYTFKVTDYMEFTSQPIAKYAYEGVEQNVSVPKKTVKVNKPYELELTLSQESIEASDQAALSIRVDNKVSDDIEVNELELIPPSFVALQTKPGELDKRKGSYYWNGSIESGKYKLINLLLKPLKSGSYVFSVNLRVTDSAGKEFSEVQNATLTATVKELEPILSITDKSVSEGSAFRVAFSVRNPNDKIGFRDITTGIRSDLFPELRAELDELLPGKTKTLIVNDTLTAPFLDEKKSYEIEAFGTYETTTNEHFEFSKTETITVSPVSDAVSIIQEFSDTEIEAGTNLTVTVKIKNNVEEAVSVKVADKYPEDVSVIGGKTGTTLYFDEAGTKQAYTYIIRIPSDYEEDKLVITTTASIGGKNYVGNKSINITISSSVEELNESKPVKKPEPKPRGTKEKKPGFIEKVINSITDFFKRVFGMKK